MKKIFSTLFAVFALALLAACNGGKKEFAIDGEFMAYEVTEHTTSGVQVPQVTMVTVTIKDGKIEKFYIDARQGTFVKSTPEATEENPDPTEIVSSVKWNEETKKELKERYAMKGVGPKYELKDGAWVEVEGKCELEWYEQAEAIEAKWLADGVDSVTVTDGRIDNVAGVTVKDGGYIKLAKEAVANAKAGKFIVVKEAIDRDTAVFYSIELTVEKGKAKEIIIDTLQSTTDPVKGTVWNEKTKQELKEDYNMKGVGPKFEFKDGAWVVVEGKCELEWYEQAKIIQDYVLANYDEKLAPISGRGATVDGETLIDAFAGVTVNTATYFELVHAVYAKANLK